MQPWAKLLLYNYWNQKPDKRVIGATGSVYVKDMGGELSNLALNYYRVSNNEVPYPLMTTLTLT